MPNLHIFCISFMYYINKFYSKIFSLYSDSEDALHIMR